MISSKELWQTEHSHQGLESRRTIKLGRKAGQVCRARCQLFREVILTFHSRANFCASAT